MRRQQKGFTLVEIAIVLVIIGLLLGGVLKGQEMIENSKIKSVSSDMNGIAAAYYAYLDRYKTLPGDEPAAVYNARGWAGAAVGNGNGVLGITIAQTFTNGGEQAAMWRALRAAQFVGGDPTSAANVAGLPRHSVGGLLGVTADPLGVYGQVGTSICASGLSTKQANGVDVLVDGALPTAGATAGIGNNIGTLRSASGAANPLDPTTAVAAGAAYNETTVVNPWTICKKI